MEKTIKRLYSLAVALLVVAPWSATHCQTSVSQALKNRLSNYFTTYSAPTYTSNTPIRLDNVEVDEARRTVTLRANAGFAEQPFTGEVVTRIRHDVERLLPPPHNTYKVRILANGTPIEELIPLVWNDTIAALRRWGTIAHKGNPWVTPLSRPYEITHGLQGRHLALWASHGRYFDTAKGTWQWQRPRLYCTSEDIFTQSFVVPFLMPMLENAGAVVFTPRERDWQQEEVIVDNDIESNSGLYIEDNGNYEWENGGKGFCKLQDIYFDGEHPFEAGTCRKAEAQPRKRQASQIVWQPRLADDGPHAVYVSYATLPTSVSDAEYTIVHRGIRTKFRVNQQMGGSTWVYLGTFDFARGCSPDNCVTLSNQSNYRGVVTADAVRFGGGMGNVSRGDSLHAYTRSHLPRYLEGSRYYAQWAGMPHAVYKNKEGVNDYAEDINTRSLMTNRLARGSAFLPGDSGLCVPLELSLAIHSDAGYRPDSTLIGTLGIYTSGAYTTTSDRFEGLLAEGLLPSKRSRLMSRDLCDVVMTQVDEDIRQVYHNWNRRQMYDRNYSETRVPEIPSMILETLSHQNFADMLRGHDPTFKQLLSRAIYKGILRYTSAVHGRKGFIVQPLPVTDFSAELTAAADSVILSWSPQDDSSAPNASPTGYVIYTSKDQQGYDNGRVVYSSRVVLPINKGEYMRFQVRAFNEGGCSMPSEQLCVYAAPHERRRLLIVNGFTRLAGPQPVDNDSLRGFDFNLDPGVVYQHSASYCGRQTNLRKDIGDNFGQSGDELAGMLMAGNTFDFPLQHAADFLLADTALSIASCAASAFEKEDQARHVQAIDLILGAQRSDGYSLCAAPALPKGLCQRLQAFVGQGGSLLVSGAYISEEIDPDFSVSTLHCTPNGTLPLSDPNHSFTGMNTHFSIYNEPNEERYSVRRLSVFQPMSDAFCSVIDGSATHALAVACQGANYRTLTYGFPLECIREADTRRAIMAASLRFILNAEN